MLDKMDVEHVGMDVERASEDAVVWEKVVRKLRLGAMPPRGLPRPRTRPIRMRSLRGWKGPWTVRRRLNPIPADPQLSIASIGLNTLT